MLSLIAVVGKNRELGQEGRLIFDLPEDMRYFKENTLRHKVLMGRKTWESLPGKLRGRENIVASRHEVVGADRVVGDLVGFLEANKDTEEEVFVIGGGEIYQVALPYAKQLYLTEVDAEVSEADTWFPKFDREEFVREVVSEGQKGDLDYQFVKYKRKEV